MNHFVTSCPFCLRPLPFSAPRSETITRETLKLRRFLRRNAVPIGLPFGLLKTQRLDGGKPRESGALNHNPGFKRGEVTGNLGESDSIQP